MEQPCKGATRAELLEKFRNRVFYYVSQNKQGVNYLKPCILDREGAWHPDTPYVVFFDDDMSLSPFSTCVGWGNLFDGWEQAHEQARHIERLYNKGFWRKPFVELYTLEHHKGEMVRIEKRINEGLKDYPNFLGIDFCDVHANGIQVRGHHKEVKGYTYGNQPTIKYDFSNTNEVIDEFIEMWKEVDKPEEVRRFKDFTEFGEKYGWD